MSVEEHNKALVRRFLDEVYNRGNLNVADDGSEMEVGPNDAYIIPQGTMPESLVMNPLVASSSPVRRWKGLPRGKYGSPIMRRT